MKRRLASSTLGFLGYALVGVATSACGTEDDGSDRAEGENVAAEATEGSSGSVQPGAELTPSGAAGADNHELAGTETSTVDEPSESMEPASPAVPGEPSSNDSTTHTGGAGAAVGAGGMPTSVGETDPASSAPLGTEPNSQGGGASVPVGSGGTPPGSGGTPSGGSAGTQALPVDFLQLYTAACSECHGAEGEGVIDKGPEIRHPSRDHFIWLVRNGDSELPPRFMEAMTAWADTLIADEMLEQMLAWLNGFPKAATGAELFHDYCANCHGADGRGGPNEYVSAYHSAPFTRRQGTAFLDYVRSGHIIDDAGNPIPVSDRHAYMAPIPPSVLSDAELQLIAAWLPQQ